MSTLIKFTCLLMTLLLGQTLFANTPAGLRENNASKFLPVDEAFALSHKYDGNTLTLQWDIAENYYLYQERLKLKVGNEKITLDKLPQAEEKEDPYFGQVKVYHKQLRFQVDVGQAKAVELSYQGCAEEGLCYPPQRRVLSLNSDVQSTTTYESTSDRFLNSFTGKSALYTLFIYFLVGVATAFAGCSYPMFPILSKIIVGQKDATKLKSFTLSLAYVLPIALVYAAIGLLAGSFGGNLANWFQQPAALIVISLILFMMALSMFGLFEIQMPSSIQTKLSGISMQQAGGSYISAAIMGFVSAFIVSACVVPPVVAAVTYITQTGDVWLGAAAMFFFGIGIGSPLLLLGLSAGWLLPKAGQWMDAVQRVMAIFLLSAAIWILDRVTPDWLTYLLWGSLAAFTSIYVTRLFPGSRLRYGSIPIAVLSLLLFVTSFSKHFDNNDNNFEYVQSMSELESLLAENHDKVVLIDFYADWCTACKKMEGDVFESSDVALQMEQFMKLKVDLSQMSKDNQALMQHFNIIGPPAFVFLTPDGNELESLRVIGELDSKDFSIVLSHALQQSPQTSSE